MGTFNPLLIHRHTHFKKCYENTSNYICCSTTTFPPPRYFPSLCIVDHFPSNWTLFYLILKSCLVFQLISIKYALFKHFLFAINLNDLQLFLLVQITLKQISLYDL